MCLSVRAALTPPHAQMLELVDRPVSDAGAQKACGFESRSVHHYASLVQLVEHGTFNAGVRSSSLRRRTICVLSSVGRATDC